MVSDLQDVKMLLKDNFGNTHRDLEIQKKVVLSY